MPHPSDSSADILEVLRRSAAEVLGAGRIDRADGVAFQIVEYVRRVGGGLSFRLPAWRPGVVSHDMFADAEPPRPTRPPYPQYTAPTSRNHDIVRFVRDSALWILAEHRPELAMSKVAALASDIADAFHRAADGRDMCYLPKGHHRDLELKYQRIWDEFDGRNYDELAARYNHSEMRIRQIVKAKRQADIEDRQRGLF
jgi:Mor family transcriptional regulator